MEKMSEKSYRIWKVVVIMLLASVTGAFIGRGDFVVPLVSMAVAVVLILVLAKKSRVRRSDERVMAVGGRAALWTFTIFALGFAIVGVVLTALAKDHVEYLPWGMASSYLSCGLIFCYTVLYWIFNKKM